VDFQVADGYRILKDIAEKNHLTTKTYKNIKHFLTAVFTLARNQGVLNVPENPMAGVSLPKGKRSVSRHAYSLDQVTAMLQALRKAEERATVPEKPILMAARTVMATAAFTGLSRSELRGLRWGDLQKGILYVNRTVWGAHVEDETKTEARRAGVPVIP